MSLSELQKVKIKKDYPVIIDGRHVSTIGKNENGTIIKPASGSFLVQFNNYIVSVDGSDILTPSVAAKAAGYKSLQEVSNLLGKAKSGHPKVSRATLRNWFFDKYELFNAVLYSAKNNKEKVI